MLGTRVPLPDPAPLPLTLEELRGFLKPTDALLMVMRGHIAIESVLSWAVLRTLPLPHKATVARLPFEFKVDLLVAFGILNLESRPAFVVFNKLRNRLAHNLREEFLDIDEQNLLNALGPLQRSVFRNRPPDPPNPHDTLRRILVILFVETTHGLFHREIRFITKFLREQILAEAVADLHRSSTTGEGTSDEGAFEERYRKCIEERGIPLNLARPVDNPSLPDSADLPH